MCVTMYTGTRFHITRYYKSASLTIFGLINSVAMTGKVVEFEESLMLVYSEFTK